jgi:hypothetical protein
MTTEKTEQEQIEALRQEAHRLKTDIDTAKDLLQQTTTEISEALNTLLEVAKDAKIKFGGKSAQEPTADQKSEDRKQRKWWLLLRFVAILVISVLIAFVPPWKGIMPRGNELLDELRVQITFLGFVVALASYLASVTRESVKSLKDLDFTETVKRKNYLAWVTTAEQSLVALGCVAIVRIVFSPMGARIPVLNEIPLLYTDQFLLIYLGVIIAYLAWVHVRQWKAIYGNRSGANFSL